MAVSRPDHTATRFRAAKACRQCHQRRVKCDALEKGIPCTRCQQRGDSDCELITSRRGTYPRDRMRTQETTRVNSASNEANMFKGQMEIDISQSPSNGHLSPGQPTSELSSP